MRDSYLTLTQEKHSKPLWAKVEWLRQCGFNVTEQDGGICVACWTPRKWRAWFFEGNPSFRSLRTVLGRSSQARYFLHSGR